MRFLSESHLDHIHRAELLRRGGEPGGRRRRVVARCLAAAEAADCERLAACAAAYVTEIACSQPYADANQRTAFMAGIVFLKINGVTLAADDGARYEQLVRGLRANPETSADLVQFLQQSVVPRTGGGSE